MSTADSIVEQNRSEDIARDRNRLGHLLTQLDAKEAARERKVNIYRLGHYLTAADDWATAVHAGKSREKAFAEVFVATRGMHNVAKQMNLRLDVERGEWVL